MHVVSPDQTTGGRYREQRLGQPFLIIRILRCVERTIGRSIAAPHWNVLPGKTMGKSTQRLLLKLG